MVEQKFASPTLNPAKNEYVKYVRMFLGDVLELDGEVSASRGPGREACPPDRPAALRNRFDEIIKEEDARLWKLY